MGRRAPGHWNVGRTGVPRSEESPHHPRTTIGTWTQGYCGVLRGGGFSWARYPCSVLSGRSLFSQHVSMLCWFFWPPTLPEPWLDLMVRPARIASLALRPRTAPAENGASSREGGPYGYPDNGFQVQIPGLAFDLVGHKTRRCRKAFRLFDSKGHLPRVVYHQVYNAY